MDNKHKEFLLLLQFLIFLGLARIARAYDLCTELTESITTTPPLQFQIVYKNDQFLLLGEQASVDFNCQCVISSSVVSFTVDVEPGLLSARCLRRDTMAAVTPGACGDKLSVDYIHSQSGNLTPLNINIGSSFASDGRESIKSVIVTFRNSQNYITEGTQSSSFINLRVNYISDNIAIKVSCTGPKDNSGQPVSVLPTTPATEFPTMSTTFPTKSTPAAPSTSIRFITTTTTVTTLQTSASGTTSGSDTTTYRSTAGRVATTSKLPETTARSRASTSSTASQSDSNTGVTQTSTNASPGAEPLQVDYGSDYKLIALLVGIIGGTAIILIIMATGYILYRRDQSSKVGKKMEDYNTLDAEPNDYTNQKFDKEEKYFSMPQSNANTGQQSGNGIFIEVD